MSYMMLHGMGDCRPELHCGCLARPSAPDWLLAEVEKALGCEKRTRPDRPRGFCGKHWETDGWPCSEAARVADALAPVIEERERWPPRHPRCARSPGGCATSGTTTWPTCSTSRPARVSAHARRAARSPEPAA